jgi:Uri superfamily endonuclease
MSETQRAQVRCSCPGPAIAASDASLPSPVESALADLGYRALDDLSALDRSEVGSYVLFIAVAEHVDLRIGRLGSIALAPGLYAYSGSALRGLRARLGRHLRTEKKMHWHVDYLLAVATTVAVWVHEGPERLECAAVLALLSLAASTCPVAGFGSSDCRCQNHLVALGL